MVAYSFHRQFVDPIRQGVKTGTVRAARMRHANVGERIQLYTAMRTKHCRRSDAGSALHRRDADPDRV
jgi:hypothetical protein